LINRLIPAMDGKRSSFNSGSKYRGRFALLQRSA
jgi:hypothetical protein